jgi:uncharacterized protein
MQGMTFIPRVVHVFAHRNTSYAFDPVTVCLVKVDNDEASFLKASNLTNTTADVGSSLGWEPSRTEKVAESLFQKGLLSTTLPKPADENPPTDRVEVLVNASQVCNLQCRYCFVDKGRFSYDEQYVEKLLPRHARRLIEVLPEGLPEMREFSIHFYGGEPLLNLPAIRAAINAAKEADNAQFTFSITTNGTVCTDEALSLLREGQFGTVLSIDGPAHIHDAVRLTKSGGPSHARVLRFLHHLRQEPPLRVRGSSVIRKGWTLREAEAYLHTLDVDTIKAQAVRLPHGHPLALDQSEREQYKDHLAELADTIIEKIKKGKAPRDDRFNGRVLQLVQGTKRTTFCGAGMWTFGVAADGTVFPCVLVAGIKSMVLGHLDEPAFNWVEQGKRWAELHGPRDECRTCWALPLCGGGCPAMLNICGEDECDLTRATCQQALAIYGAFYPDRLADLLVLAGICG